MLPVAVQIVQVVVQDVNGAPGDGTKGNEEKRVPNEDVSIEQTRRTEGGKQAKKIFRPVPRPAQRKPGKPNAAGPSRESD